uniref:NADH-ubiquinone oxidoreductase chain 6 n=1 Tax=Cucujoidea sp. 42 KM-2017 TaxID=2219381 RepID=A0A346RJ11_9CUCU|nr:NADH dehydrogenase subunit 6 [Cucujoidea sp. 42 KM-2017]
MLTLILIKMNSLIMLFMKHPLALGMMILIQTFFISIFMNSIFLNFWYSYIILLVMIGGLLILFIYMTSIASNEKFKMNYKIFFTTMTLALLELMFFNLNSNLSMNEFTLSMKEKSNLNLSLISFHNYPNSKIFIFSIIYLLITLIILVKICLNQKGPLRQIYENT